MEIEPYTPPGDGKPDAIICDIDGTLAHPTTRGYHDYTLLHTDDIDPVVRDLLDREWAVGYEILIVTGRPHEVHRDTRRWLLDNHIPVDLLLTSPPGVEDYVAKYDLFNKYIRNEYNVEYVLDDRNRVVDMWRRLGLKVLQVADGDY